MNILLGGLLLTLWALNGTLVLIAALKASDIFSDGWGLTPLSLLAYVGTLGLLGTLSVSLWSLVL